MKQVFSHLHFKERNTLFIRSSILTIVIISGLMFVEYAENRRFIENQRRSIIEKLSTIRAKLEGDLHSDIYLTRSITTEVILSNDISKERFERIAAHFFKEVKHMRNIGLAKGTVLQYVYPFKGNEKAVGLEFKKKPKQWPSVKKAIDLRTSVLAGPVDLVQGGQGIIGRSPIFIPDPKSGEDKFYGLLSIVITISSLFEAAGLNDNDSLFSVAIRGKDALGEKGDVFYGPESLFDKEPVLMNILLPGGSWQMAAIPINGWEMTSPSIPLYRLIALLVGMVILYLLFTEQREINTRKKVEKEREKVIKELSNALSDVKQLSGLLPICANCKKIRDDDGYWKQIESYICEHSEANFSHSICKDCAKKLYPHLDPYGEEK